MATPYIGEIKAFGGNFAIFGWAFCNGQLLSISQNEALFNLIGTFYGGDGINTFGLPDLRGRFVVHQGNGGVIGQAAGSETVTLSSQTIPAHTHIPIASATQGTQAGAANAIFAGSAGAAFYTPRTGTTAFASQAIQPAGGNQPHDNMQPYLAISYLIALEGVYPTPS